MKKHIIIFLLFGSFTPGFSQNFLGYNIVDLVKYHRPLDYIYFESDTNQHGVPFFRTENRRTRETTIFFFNVILQCHEYNVFRSISKYDELIANLNRRFIKEGEYWYDYEKNTKYQIAFHKTSYQLKITYIKDEF